MNQSWRGLNATLKDADEAMCKRLLRSERKLAHALRIHSRLNYVRAHRERAELRSKLER